MPAEIDQIDWRDLKLKSRTEVVDKFLYGQFYTIEDIDLAGIRDFTEDLRQYAEGNELVDSELESTQAMLLSNHSF